MMKLMRLRLENILKIKVMKKTKQLTSKQFKDAKLNGKKSIPGSLQKQLPNPGTCPFLFWFSGLFRSLFMPSSGSLSP